MEIARTEHFAITAPDDVPVSEKAKTSAIACLAFAEKQRFMEKHANLLLTACKMALADMEGYERHMQQNVFETKDLLRHVIAKAEGK